MPTTKTVNAMLDDGLKVWETLIDYPYGLTTKLASEKSGVDYNKTSRALSNLQRLGYVYRDPNTDAWRLTSKPFELIARRFDSLIKFTIEVNKINPEVYRNDTTSHQ